MENCKKKSAKITNYKIHCILHLTLHEFHSFIEEMSTVIIMIDAKGDEFK